jgi:hypothetical protein
MWFVGNIDSGFVVKSTRGLTINGVQYPRNIFTQWSREQLAELDILPYREIGVNSKYQWQGQLTRAMVNGEVVGTYAGIDRDVDGLKNNMISQVRQIASSKIAETDWMVIREADGGTAMNADVKAYRAAVRTDSNRKETEINALADLDAVKAYDNHPVTMVNKTKHTSDEGVETYGDPLITRESTVSKVNSYGWAIDPLADVDPSFVSINDN